MDEIFDRLFGKHLAPSDLPLEDLDRILRLLFDIEDQVPEAPLPGRQKLGLSPYLFMQGPLVVRGVADALRQDGLYPEIDLDPERMDGGLPRAARWLSIREVALRLAACADRNYTIEIATRVRDAMRVLQHVHEDGERKFGAQDELRAVRRAGGLTAPASDLADRYSPAKK